jgi:O-antigen ligase
LRGLRQTLARFPLEQVVWLGIVATVIDIATGSTWSQGVRSVAGPLRWVLLGGLCALSIVYALAVAGPRIPRAAPFWLGAGLLGVVALSTAWSVLPRTTAERAISFGAVVVSAAALAVAVAGRRDAAGRLLLAVLGGAVSVALIGLVLLAANRHAAVQSATASTPTRFRGLGQNPNTVVMLFAVGMPIAVWVAVARRGLARHVAVAALLLLAGSIVASGSRGALVAGFVAALAPALAAAPTTRFALAAVAVCAVSLAAALLITKIPKPNPNAHGTTAGSAQKCTKQDAECVLRLEDEIGRPPGGRFEKPKHRGILGSSGRGDAWRGALEQGADRPLAGYGFGTESRVFVDRYYSFEGGVPENSYVGMFLQLGAVGAAVFLALLGSLALAAGRALLPAGRDGRVLAATCGAVLFVGLALAFFQSYLYAAGNNATLSVWICSFLVTALAAH